MFQKHSKSKNLEDESIGFLFCFAFFDKSNEMVHCLLPRALKLCQGMAEGRDQALGNKEPRSQKAPESSQPSILLTQ